MKRYQINYKEDSILRDLLKLVGEREEKEISKAYEDHIDNNLPENIIAVDYRLKWVNIALSEQHYNEVKNKNLFIEEEPSSLSGSEPLVFTPPFPSQNIADPSGKIYSNEWAYVEWDNTWANLSLRVDSYHGGSITWGTPGNQGKIPNGSKIINPSLFYMGHTKLWEEGFHGEGMRVGVIDTGATTNTIGSVIPNNPDVPVRASYNSFGTNGVETINDTHAWARINQIGGNGRILGGAYKAQIYAANYSNLQMSVKWCIDNGCDVINCSFTGSRSAYLNALVLDFTRRGGHFVVAAGNGDYTSPVSLINNLAAVPSAIAVSSIAGGASYKFIPETRHTSLISVDGNGIDFHAPEACVSPMALLNNDSSPIYNPYDNGTSTSAAYVSALLALYKQKYPYISSEARIQMLKRTCEKIPGSTLIARYK